MSTIHLPEITQAVDESIEVLRVCAEKGVFESEDLLARMVAARSRVERIGIALHLAEQFVRSVEPVQVDQSIATLARDLVNAIRRAQGSDSIREHYEGVARDAQQAAA